MSEEKNVVVPDKFKTLVDQIEKMSVLDLSELVHILEEKFGVSAQAMVAAMPSSAGASSEGAGEATEKSSFDVELASAGEQKIAVIKVIREATGLGLKESKDIVDGAPKVVKTGVAKAEAEELKKKLVEAGATVNLK